jgi:hypothetical protein
VISGHGNGHEAHQGGDGEGATRGSRSGSKPRKLLGEKRIAWITAKALGKGRSRLNSGASGTERLYRHGTDSDPGGRYARRLGELLVHPIE